MIASKCALLAALTLALVGSACADQSVVGNWKGTMTFDIAHSKRGMSHTGRYEAEKKLAQFNNLMFALELKKDGKYVFTVMGGPTQKRHKPDTGKWMFVQHQVVLSSDIVGTHPFIMAVAKDGKTMRSVQYNGTVVTTFKR